MIFDLLWLMIFDLVPFKFSCDRKLVQCGQIQIKSQQTPLNPEYRKSPIKTYDFNLALDQMIWYVE